MSASSSSRRHPGTSHPSASPNSPPAYRPTCPASAFSSIPRFDWSLLDGFDHPLPWALSGGLNAANVADAIARTRAPLVDVSSGVESAPGVKDVDKIAAFLKATRA